jgi:SAM-dependent methyltransferase
MVDLCNEKGLEAYVMDFLSLDYPPDSFDDIYDLNCLLHVPTRDLPAVLRKLRGLLRSGGLFYLGVYGGIEQEGMHEDDFRIPPRFFAHHTDEFMQRVTAPFFNSVSFKAIPLQNKAYHFQSMVLRKKRRFEPK